MVFKDEELNYNGLIANRVKMHFQLGLLPDTDRIDWSLFNDTLVADWWNTSAKRIVHKKLMEKKANVLMEVRKLMKSK